MSKQQSGTYKFVLGSSVKDIDKIEHAINELRSQWDLGEKSLFHLNLVLEELISNTMFYGFDDNKNGKIEVELSFDGDYIYVSIHDDAKAFDPSIPAEQSVNIELDERAIGGLGIVLTQQISEDMKYNYHENKNKLSFKIKAQNND